MDEKEFLLREMRSAQFAKNNNRVLCTINILRSGYIGLSSVQDVLQNEMDESEFLDCINFLTKAKYIDLRTVRGKTETTIADTDYHLLEASLSEKGIRLLGGEIIDKLIRR